MGPELEYEESQFDDSQYDDFDDSGYNIDPMDIFDIEYDR